MNYTSYFSVANSSNNTFIIFFFLLIFNKRLTFIEYNEKMYCVFIMNLQYFFHFSYLFTQYFNSNRSPAVAA